MSSNPHLTIDDLENCKDAMKCYLDYLVVEGVRKENPKLYEAVRTSNLHLLDCAQYMKSQNIGAIELKPVRTY